MKKTLCVIIAIVIALSSLTMIVSAASVPKLTLKTSTATAKVGDIVTVEVTVAKNSRLCALTLDLVYDNTCFKALSMIPTDIMEDPTCNLEYEENKVRYAAIMKDLLNDDGVLFTAEFEVIKTGGTFSLEFNEACKVRPLGNDNNVIDLTEDMNSEYADYSVKVECAHAVKETTVIEEATCAKVGSKTEKCKECEWISEVIEIPMLPHEIEETIIKGASCTEDGIKSESCKNCDYKSEETPIPATGHIPDEWNTVTEATCEEEGLKVQHCKACDAKLSEDKIPAKGHTENEWVVVKAPTTTEKGLEQKECTVCGKILDEKEIPMIPQYKLGDVSEDGSITAVDARKILRYVAGLETLSEAQKLAADVNKDGTIGATDARMILQYVVGKVKF